MRQTSDPYGHILIECVEHDGIEQEVKRIIPSTKNLGVAQCKNRGITSNYQLLEIKEQGSLNLIGLFLRFFKDVC